VIRFIGYGVIAEKPCISQLGRIFPCTLYEKLCVGSKNEYSFLMVLRRSITMQNIGKIVQRAPAVGAKMWCFLLFFVTLRVLGTVCSKGA